MNSNTVKSTIFWEGADLYIQTMWDADSAIRQIWDKYPGKQSWISNSNYTVKPISDEFISDNSSTYCSNKVKNKASN